MRSILSAVMARFAGERANTGTILVPTRIREVNAASWDNEVNAPSPQDPPMVRQLYPTPSASTALSRISRHDIPGTCNPIMPTSPMVRCSLYVSEPTLLCCPKARGDIYQRRETRTAAHSSVIGSQIYTNYEPSIWRPRELKNGGILMGETLMGRHGKK